MASVLSTRSVPGAGERKAASSAKPSAPGIVASGLKNRSISRSSPDTSLLEAMASSRGPAEFAGAQLAGKLVEHRIDHACFVASHEGRGDIRIFSNDNTSRHIAAVVEFVSAGPQRRAEHRFETLEWPTFRQGFVNERVERALFAHDPGNDIAEKSGLRRQILGALNLSPHPMTFKFRQNLVEPGSSQIHLVQSLHGGQARSATAIGLTQLLVANGARGHQRQTSVCLRAAMVSAVRAAAPPLSPSSSRARASACDSLSTVRIPLPIGSRSRTLKSISARADSFATISKWCVSPRITQPSATTPSYGSRRRAAASMLLAIAAGISSAPGTLTRS